jgi:hypothetical protein
VCAHGASDRPLSIHASARSHPMITTKKSVSVEVDFATMKKLGRARRALSEVAGAFIEAVDDRSPAKDLFASR